MCITAIKSSSPDIPVLDGEDITLFVYLETVLNATGGLKFSMIKDP